eukprot:gene20267-27021_t
MYKRCDGGDRKFSAAERISGRAEECMSVGERTPWGGTPESQGGPGRAWADRTGGTGPYADARRVPVAAQSQKPLASGSSSPVLIFDIMDTVVFDPFFTEMPKFFDMSFPELMKAKHPSAWLEFEKNQCTQEELFARFFADRREFDSEGLLKMMVEQYRYLEGMEELLQRLRDAGYEMHVMSNYPMWFKMIEDKLAISKYMPWTFISCDGHMEGIRKPDPAAYEMAISIVGRPASNIIFVDDRSVNVEAAEVAGINGIIFSGAADLEVTLRGQGLEF